MKIQLLSALNNTNIDASQGNSQRQLEVSISAIADELDTSLPLNLCLILDKSGSMHGESMSMVINAVEQLIDQLQSGDRIAIVAFAGSGEIIIPNQIIKDPKTIKSQLHNKLKAGGGTIIGEGLSLGITELLKGSKGACSHAFLLTDGYGDNGFKIWRLQIGPNDNQRCLELAQKAARLNLTINSFGFGDEWNQDLLEKIADAGGGTLAYIETPQKAIEQFNRIFKRIQSVGLTNAHLLLSLVPGVRLADLKPVAQVAPETIELPISTEPNGTFVFRLGDLMKDGTRRVLANIYLGSLPEGEQIIGHIQVRYDNPAVNKEAILSPLIPVYANVTKTYQPANNPHVLNSVLALAKYRQTQVAETKLESGDRTGAITMLQTAAKTALQIGDSRGATVLQSSATRLQNGEELSDAERKKTRIASKTILMD
ncbi:MAG: hypothetical protein RLZZ29_1207 [Cyanobacteriota bacterium]|jgi:Ca-activated chloride channel family protein|uniref:vWA domain-containing protein n=1 Tax=Cylindrospermopsis raciborskii TaxID=77022 RepID=UPI001A217E9B|nr:VWA domain-containing protein [Cylindrospermopsis raciborskii]MBG0743733.1 VWA domain-containing protein [Cylindrospermopsis raciborskii KL1]